MRNDSFSLFLTLGWLLLAGCVASFMTGCHSRPPLEELGELEFAVPNLPGIDKPYPLPDASEKSDAGENHGQLAPSEE